MYRVMVKAYTRDTLESLLDVSRALRMPFRHSGGELISARYSGDYWHDCETRDDAEALQDLLADVNVFAVKYRL